MLSRHAITFAADIQKGIHQNRFLANDAPDGGSRLDKLLLEHRLIRIPKDFKGEFRTKTDTLTTSDAPGKIITGIPVDTPLSRLDGTHLDAGPAPGTAGPDQRRARIAVHPLFLGPGSESHGDVLYGTAKASLQVSLKVG